MIEQLTAKTKWFLRDTSPIASVLIFVSIALLVILFFIFVKKKRELKSIFYAVAFSMSLTLIIMFTLLRKPDAADFGFERVCSSLPSAFIFDSESNVVFNLNILLFVPFAFVLRWKISAKLTVVICAFLSVCIEIVQMLCRLGIFEVADILGNSLGAIAAVLLYQLMEFVIKQVKMKMEAEKKE
ncbi:MAG: VanZ family protein [Ruminococcus sp.]|nr:VanZ family protein [Ruminococcus sp.]